MTFVGVQNTEGTRNKFVVHESEIQHFDPEDFDINKKYKIAESGDKVQILFVKEKEQDAIEALETKRNAGRPLRMLQSSTEETEEETVDKGDKNKIATPEDSKMFNSLVDKRLQTIRNRIAVAKRSSNAVTVSKESSNSDDKENAESIKRKCSKGLNKLVDESKKAKLDSVPNRNDENEMAHKNTASTSEVRSTIQSSQIMLKNGTSHPVLDYQIWKERTIKLEEINRNMVLELSNYKDKASHAVEREARDNLLIQKLKDETTVLNSLIDDLNEENERLIRNSGEREAYLSTNELTLTTRSTLLIKKGTQAKVGDIDDNDYLYMGNDRWILNRIYEMASHDFPNPPVFINNIAVAIFGITGLERSTITGRKSNASKVETTVPLLQFCRNDVLAIKSLFQYFLETNFIMSDVDINDYVEKTKSYIGRKAASVKINSANAPKKVLKKVSKKSTSANSKLTLKTSKKTNENGTKTRVLKHVQRNQGSSREDSENESTISDSDKDQEEVVAEIDVATAKDKDLSKFAALYNSQVSEGEKSCHPAEQIPDRQKDEENARKMLLHFGEIC